MGHAAPVSANERIDAIDVIRGFALFGVLWMNLYEQRGLAIPYEALAGLPTAWIDRWISYASAALMEHKAQTLFSILFGFGFANIMARLEAKGAPPTVFLRRIGVLFVFGLIDMLMLWIGDILFPYALMGFLLYFTRHWKTRTLILVGLPLTLLNSVALHLFTDIFWNGESGTEAIWENSARIRGAVFQQADYGAYVAELVRGSWSDWFSQPVVWPFFAQVIGRFLVGSWVYRKGWFDNIAANRAVFAKLTAIALPLGLVINLVTVAGYQFQNTPEWFGTYFAQLGVFSLAVGYGAAITLLVLAGRCKLLFAGFRASGRMALTNYITQSFFYLFVIYGFGFNLLPVLGATLSFGLALGFYLAQMIFSHWWLQRYHFGPLEWVWRALTYGEKPAMRKISAGAAAAA